MNFPRENSYLTFSGWRWIQPGLRTRKRHLYALKSLFIARAREKSWSASFFSNRPLAFAALSSPSHNGRPCPRESWIERKKEKKKPGFQTSPQTCLSRGDIEFSRVWRGGGRREIGDKEEDLPSIMIRPSFPHDLPKRLASRVARKLDWRGE